MERRCENALALVRVSVGLEESAVQIRDFTQELEAAG